VAGERKTSEVTKEELANLMVGRDVVLTVEKESKRISAEPIVHIKDLVVKADNRMDAVRGVSIDIRPGEIVGIAGVDGNGQTELAEALVGLREVTGGEIRFKGEDISNLSPKERIRRHFSYVPADRQRYGLVLPMTVAENIIIGQHDITPYCTGLNLNLKRINDYSQELVESYDIRTPSVDVPAGNLSGGNQQKVILAREFARKTDFLLISQPTRGLDVGAIEYIQSQILRMRDAEAAILLISLELEEIFALSDRILVLYEGRIVKEFIPEQTTHKEVGFFMTGGKKKEEPA
jgi:simple sugar transport system ATP-binding protein